MNALWRSVALGDVLREDRERVVVEPGGGYSIAGVLIAGRGLFWRETINGSATKYPALYRLRAGQLVYRKLTAWEGPITVVPDAFDGGYVSSEFPTFTLDESQLLPEFMRWTCKQPSFHEEMRARSTGTAERRNRLAPADLLEIEIELPPLDQQRAIVELCSAAERVVATAREEARCAFGALRSATQELLSTAEGWEDLPDGWTLASLSDVCDIRSGITKGRKPRGELRPVPFIRAANVQNGFLDLTEMKTLDVSADEVARFGLQPGDVLLVEGSGSVHRLGHGWIWSGEIKPCVHQNHVFRVRPDPAVLRPRFLAHALSASVAREHFAESAKTTSGLATINKAQTGACPVPLPPVEAQDALLATLDALRRTAVKAERAASAAERMQSALIEELLSGERRVRIQAQ